MSLHTKEEVLVVKNFIKNILAESGLDNGTIYVNKRKKFTLIKFFCVGIKYREDYTYSKGAARVLNTLKKIAESVSAQGIKFKVDQNHCELISLYAYVNTDFNAETLQYTGTIEKVSRMVSIKKVRADLKAFVLNASDEVIRKMQKEYL